MAEKFLKLGTSGVEEKEATVQSTGASDAGKIVALDSDGKLHTSVLPTGVGAEVKVAVTSENLSAGDLVNFWSDAGTLKVRKADASNNRPAHGFVLNSVASGNNATVYLEGTITGLTGLTPGARYWLSATTPGGVTTTIPTTSGHIAQEVGIAISTTELSFERQQPITRG